MAISMLPRYGTSIRLLLGHRPPSLPSASQVIASRSGPASSRILPNVQAATALPLAQAHLAPSAFFHSTATIGSVSNAAQAPVLARLSP